MNFPFLKNIRVAFFLGLKSIIKGNRGTLVMVIAMMALVFNNLIFLTAIMNGLVATANSQIIDYLSGHIVIEPQDGKDYIFDARNLQKKVNQIYGVAASTLRTDFGGEIEFNGRRSNFQISAMDPKTEPQVTRLHEKIIEGQYLDEDDTDSIMIGIQIAGPEGIELETYSLHGVHAGDRVKVTFLNGFEKEYTVKGIFDASFVQADLRTFINKKEYDALFPEQKHISSQMLIRTKEGEDLNTLAQTIKDQGIDENIRTWEETAGIIKSVTESFSGINILVSTIALFVAGITIFIVIYVDILNRRKDIGILRAIGIKESAIGMSYLFRSLFYTICGILIGMFVFYYMITPYFQHNPMRLPLGDVSLVISNDLLYVKALSLLVAAFLGAFIPVRRALRIKIIDAIWGE